MADDSDDPTPDLGFEIVQKINPVRLLQLNLEALNAAGTPSKAALHLARLYLNLKGIRSIDETFETEWAQIVGGDFMAVAGRDELRFRITWDTVWRAQECLQDLMERRGMSFQAQLDDPAKTRASAAVARVAEMRQGLRSHPAVKS